MGRSRPPDFPCVVDLELGGWRGAGLYHLHKSEPAVVRAYAELRCIAEHPSADAKQCYLTGDYDKQTARDSSVFADRSCTREELGYRATMPPYPLFSAVEQ